MKDNDRKWDCFCQHWAGTDVSLTDPSARVSERDTVLLGGAVLDRRGSFHGDSWRTDVE